MDKSAAMALGCRCSECPLRDQPGPVLPERHTGAPIAIVGDLPMDHEVREGRPFVGPAGTLLVRTLKTLGIRRNDIHWTTTLLCQAPENKLDRFLVLHSRKNKEIERDNKRRAKEAVRLKLDPATVQKDPLIPSPVDCCKPRLLTELDHFANIIPMGGLAVRTVIGRSASVLDIRGGPLERVRGIGPDGEPRRAKILPTLHPAFVQQSPRYTHVLASDLGRALRYFTDQMNWHPPKVTYHPTAVELQAFIDQHQVLSCDVETDAFECLTANMRCIALGTDTEVMVVGTRPKGAMPNKFLGPDEARNQTEKFWGFYPPHELGPVLEVLKRWLVDPMKIKVGHNFGYYDYLCIEAQLGVQPAPVIDTMLIHRLVESELPHSLGFVGSLYTDAPSWKVDREGRKKALSSETDDELHEYCAYDVSITHAVLAPLLKQVAVRKQSEVMETDHGLQKCCAGMHRVGLWVNQDIRMKFEVDTTVSRDAHRTAIKDLLGYPLNPGSTMQVRKLLFTEWGLEPNIKDKFRFTQGGDPSTSDDVIRACLIISTLEPHQRRLLELVRYYRKDQKVLGTYITKIRPNTDIAQGWDDDEAWAERQAREVRGEVRKGIVDPRTGRMHPGYNAHVTTTGRLSSSTPINAQNFPGRLRSMVWAAPGHMLVGADADQLELRIAASRWKSIKYLDAFDRGLDPHSSVTALAVFGDRFRAVAGSDPPWPTGTKFTGNAKKLRGLAKSVQYASQYWATVETVHRVITQTEQYNDDGTIDLPYLRIALREVRAMHEKWVEGARFDWGWEREMSLYKQQGFLTEPIMGRRRDFLDGENPNEIVNFPIQAAGASLMNIAILEVMDAIPFEQWGTGTGIVNQCHDSIVVECPLDGASWSLNAEGERVWDVPKGSIPWRVKHIIEEAMNMTHPGLPGVAVTASADYGAHWGEV